MKISYKNLPVRPPLLLTAIVYLLMDKWAVSEFWQGVIWVFVVLLWLIFIVAMWKQETVDVSNLLKFIKEESRGDKAV